MYVSIGKYKSLSARGASSNIDSNLSIAAASARRNTGINIYIYIYIYLFIVMTNISLYVSIYLFISYMKGTAPTGSTQRKNILPTLNNR
jgi:hypothetical protein